MKKVVLLTIGLLMVCNCAFAAITPIGIGSLDSGEKAFSGSFFDVENDLNFIKYFSFSISNVSDVKSLTASFDSAASNFGITGLAFSLFSDDAYTSEILPTTSELTTNPLLYSFNNLIGTTYYFTVSGKVLAGTSGMFAGSLSASQVPVPAAALLLGAGLLGIVGIRRRQSV